MSQEILSADEIKSIYGRIAQNYDSSVALFNLLGFRINTYRKTTVENLKLEQGNTVVDLGCGTGLNLEYLQQKIGSGGRIIGIDLSSDMLAQAKQRAQEAGWDNVELIQADMANYDIPDQADGILSTLALTMSPDYDHIIKKISDSLQPGQRLSIFELKNPAHWPDWLVRTMVKMLHSYGTRLAHTKRTPWKSMSRYFDKSSINKFYFGAVYVATGEAI